MDAEIDVIELPAERTPDVVDLCRRALDLPEDAAEADALVDTLWSRAGAERPVVVLGAYRAGVLVGVLICSVSARDARLGHADLVAVDPAYRRRGTGRALLAWAERSLAGLGAAEVLLAGNPPCYGWPGIDVRYTPAVCAALALGYTRDDTAWNMTADLSYAGSPALRTTEAAQARLAGEGVSVRRAEPADLPALVTFARTTFGGSWDAELAGSLGRDRAGCHLAERDGELLGFAAWGSSRPSWFGPMGTAPAAEGSGIGGVLLRRCLADQRAAGIDRAQIGWVGPVPFYSGSAGARIERVFFLYRKAARPPITAFALVAHRCPLPFGVEEESMSTQDEPPGPLPFERLDYGDAEQRAEMTGADEAADEPVTPVDEPVQVRPPYDRDHKRRNQRPLPT